MKRKSESSPFDVLRHKFPSVKLYRSDLDEIIELAEKRSLKVSISDDKYEYDNLDEVAEQRGKFILTLSFNISEDGSSSYETLDIDIQPTGVVLRTAKNDSLVSLWHEIKDLISKRTPWYAKLLSPLLYAYCAIGIMWITPDKEKLDILPSWAQVSIIVAFVIFLSLSIYSYIYARVNRGIYMQKEHEILTFWQRNGEKLLFVAVGTIFGVIGKIITDYFAGN